MCVLRSYLQFIIYGCVAECLRVLLICVVLPVSICAMCTDTRQASIANASLICVHGLTYMYIYFFCKVVLAYRRYVGCNDVCDANGNTRDMCARNSLHIMDVWSLALVPAQLGHGILVYRQLLTPFSVQNVSNKQYKISIQFTGKKNTCMYKEQPNRAKFTNSMT